MITMAELQLIAENAVATHEQSVSDDIVDVLRAVVPLICADAAKAERERIVACLRNVTSNGTRIDPAVGARIFADMIERGPSS